MLWNSNSGPLQLSYVLIRWMGKEWIQSVVPGLSLLLLMADAAIQFFIDHSTFCSWTGCHSGRAFGGATIDEFRLCTGHRRTFDTHHT
jgi:hypothetical protein